MEQKENLKIGLLGVIAVTLIINTFFMNGTSDNNSSAAPSPAKISENNSITPQTAPTPIANPTLPEQPVGPTTSIEYAEADFNFGKVKQDSENEHVFKFKNTGTEPLLISNARGSCGCTVPQYPTEPIPPGESGEIKVVYKPGKQKGSQSKTVTVTANTNPAQTVIQIKADVEETS